MAGMLPGVELARRRRLPRACSWVEPQPTTAYSSARRIALCLARNHKASSSSSSSGHSNRYDDDDDDDKKLGGVAREAKERLDERLRSQTRKMSDYRRNDNNRNNLRNTRPGQPHDNQIRRELPGLTSSSTKWLMSWTKLTGWKGSSDHEQCAVCLERLVSGETLMNLPCNHRFHTACLVPWLEHNLQCPCCRAVVITS